MIITVQYSFDCAPSFEDKRVGKRFRRLQIAVYVVKASKAVRRGVRGLFAVSLPLAYPLPPWVVVELPERVATTATEARGHRRSLLGRSITVLVL